MYQHFLCPPLRCPHYHQLCLNFRRRRRHNKHLLQTNCLLYQTHHFLLYLS